MAESFSDVKGMLKWLETATREEIYQEALLDEHAGSALTLVDHVLMGTRSNDVIGARARMLKGKLFKQEGYKDAADHLSRGLRDAKSAELPPNDPQVEETKRLLKELVPPDPDGELLAEYKERISDYLDITYQRLKRERSDESDGAAIHDAIFNDLADGWKVLLTCSRFDDHVVVEGMAGYFANTLGEGGEEIIAAFKTLDKNLAKSVENAFELFAKVQSEHETSSELRTPDVNEFDIMPAGETPGRFDDDEEYYKNIEETYLKQAESITQYFVNLIRSKPKLFPPLRDDK